VSFLVDTNVISELVRPRPNQGVVAWAGARETLTLSVITLEEMLYGLALRRNMKVQRWLERFVEQRCNVLEVTASIARHAGTLRGQLAARGRVRSQADMLIAATAAQHGLTLATRNERDFDDCGVPVENPFS
jgi:toxin FitB